MKYRSDNVWKKLIFPMLKKDENIRQETASIRQLYISLMETEEKSKIWHFWLNRHWLVCTWNQGFDHSSDNIEILLTGTILILHKSGINLVSIRNHIFYFFFALNQNYDSFYITSGLILLQYQVNPQLEFRCLFALNWDLTDHGDW